MRHFLLIPASLLFAFVNPLTAKTITLRGYVTAVHSPVSFEMDKYKVADDTGEEHRRLNIKEGAKDSRSPQLKPGSLRIGLEVEVKGSYDPNTGEVKATGIKALFDDQDPATQIEGMGLVEDKSSLQKSGHAWSGRVVADETLVIAPDTAISVKRSRTERKELQADGRETDQTLFSPDDIDLDTFAHYTGVRQPDHSILAKTIEFRQDRGALESGWHSVEPDVIYPDPKSGGGELTNGERKYQLFPSPEAADYLGKLGASLIPAQQRALPDKSPGKTAFQFFLANTNSVSVDTYPNGVIVVSVHVFDALENEAQLAFVLSHEIARVVEKQEWTAANYHESERHGVLGAGMAASVAAGPAGPLLGLLVDKRIAHQFARSLHDQADRIGIEYMIAAGYDPNQSVEAWRVLDEKRVKGPFWGDRDTNFTRRTYLESELHLDYATRDFSTLKRDSSDFHRAVDAVKAARHLAKGEKKLGADR